jgi:ABC-type multidrug transport system fused ATPase/permease subunit
MTITKVKYFSLIKRILKYAWKNDPKLFLNFFFYTVVSGVYPVAAILLPKVIVDELTKDVVNYDHILLAVFIFLAVTIVFGFFKSYLKDTSEGRITLLRVNLFNEVCDKFLTLDYEYSEDPNFLDEHENVIQALSRNDVGIEKVMNIMFGVFGELLSLIFYFLIVGSLSIYILLIIIINVIANFYFSQIVKKYRYKRKNDITHTSRRRRYYMNVSHDFSYGKDIRLFNVQDKIIKKYDREVKSYLNVFRKIFNLEYKLGFADVLLLLVQDLIVYAILINQALNNPSFQIGDLLMYIGAVAALSISLKKVILDNSDLIGELLYVSDYYKFIDTSYYKNQGTLPTLTDQTFSIEFKNVSFKYPKSDRYIYKNLNFKIEKGKKIAIVGVNGAGKTTLVKMLTRLYEIEEGDIFINGINIKEFDKREYYKMFSVVFQEFQMMAFTIKENVALTNKDIDTEKVEKSLEMVGLNSKIKSLDQGLDQMMLKILDPKGVEFSGGENQKMAIARALYKDAGMIILDEPTAALDALAEEEIYQNFNQLIGDKTAIYISHRLASTRFCDQIVLIGPNGIEEMGTHDELIKRKGKYYQMFMIQGKYYQEGESHETYQTT